MMPLCGEALFVQQYKRVAAAKLVGTLVVATTTDEIDNAIEELCIQKGIACFRGNPLDLLDRHYQAARAYNADVVIKIPSDCPLIDTATIDRTIQYYLDNIDRFDFVSNLHPATFPDGNDVEIMPFALLETAWKEATKDFEREHTTPFFWERPERFRIGNVEMQDGINLALTHRWTIDYLEDYLFIKKVYESLYPSNPLFGMEDILGLISANPDIFAINSHLAGVNWYRNHLDELHTIKPSDTKIV